jgi:tetratricopeptide (TPR) repeat protein/DNA-binding CsgD family transcriptional regulator
MNFTHVVVLIAFAAIGLNFCSAQDFDASLTDSDPRYSALNDTTFILARKQLAQAIERHDSVSAAQAHHILGEFYFELGSFEASVEHFLDAERYLIGTKEETLLYATLAELGRVHYYTGDHQGSIKHYNEALAGFQSLGDSAGEADVFGRIGHFYEKQGDYEKALSYQRQALSYFGTHADSLAVAGIYENIGSIYEDLMLLDSADLYFNLALRKLEGTTNFHMIANVYNNLGDVKRKSGDFRKGLYYTRLGLKYADKVQSSYLRKSAFRDMAKTYLGLGRSDSAYIYLDLAYVQLDSIFNLEVAKQVARSQVMFDVERKEINLKLQKAEIALLEKERSLGLQVQYILGIAFSILLIAAVWLFRIQRQKGVSDRLLFEEREVVYKAKNALSERDLEHAALNEAKLKAELENKRLREIFLNEQLELRSNELTSQTLKIIRKNKLLDSLKTKVDSGDANRVSEVRKLIDRHLRVDKNWEGFQDLFEKVHDDFYRKLMQRAPDLSPGEIRLCCLLKLNLPSKDMAAMLGISPDSLRIARYRLRKKLKLARDERLPSFIIGL